MKSCTNYLGARIDSSNDSMVMNNLDLNYLGVFDAWTGDLGKLPIFRSTEQAFK